MPATVDIHADRRLLLPGPLPPLSHLGATLLRHSVHTALRYALYQLGQATPESPPTRLVALRLFLDASALRESLAASAASEEILGALLNPGGAALKPLPKRLRGMLWFHRRRLSLKTAAVRWPKPGRKPAAGCRGPRARLSQLLPTLGDGMLGDLIAALDRRRSRADGLDVARVQSLEAARFLEGARADLSRIGLPDPRVASWRDSQPPLPPEAAALDPLRCPSHRLRGGFREQYRHFLDLLLPELRALGNRAAARGYLASTEDVFFLPLDLIDDLDRESKPVWIEEAVLSNRKEWQELRGREPPAETFGDLEPRTDLDLPDDFAPLWPLD